MSAELQTPQTIDLKRSVTGIRNNLLITGTSLVLGAASLPPLVTSYAKYKLSEEASSLVQTAGSSASNMLEGKKGPNFLSKSAAKITEKLADKVPYKDASKSTFYKWSALSGFFGLTTIAGLVGALRRLSRLMKVGSNPD